MEKENYPTLNRITATSKEEHIKEVLEYILEGERQDFKEHIDENEKNHVYYHAYAAMFGEEAAEEMYQEALAEFNE